jgi:hypothetical protein
MWKLLQRNQGLRGMVEISAADLSALLGPLFSKLIVLDLRRQDEVDHYPYIIPGALLTTKVDVPALITWLPLRSWVVLYATDDMPRSYSRLHLLRNDLSFYVLSAGLRAWWSAGFAMETISLREFTSPRLALLPD